MAEATYPQYPYFRYVLGADSEIKLPVQHLSSFCTSLNCTHTHTHTHNFYLHENASQSHKNVATTHHTRACARAHTHTHSRALTHTHNTPVCRWDTDEERAYWLHVHPLRATTTTKIIDVFVFVWERERGGGVPTWLWFVWEVKNGEGGWKRSGLGSPDLMAVSGASHLWQAL